jgi:hypothetical protein
MPFCFLFLLRVKAEIRRRQHFDVNKKRFWLLANKFSPVGDKQPKTLPHTVSRAFREKKKLSAVPKAKKPLQRG